MDDMASKISELLNDPDGMQKIMSVANTLFSKDAVAEPVITASKTEENSGLSLPDGFDPLKLMGIVSAFQNKDNDRRSQLLLALKPHLSFERQEKIDKAVKLLKIAAILPILKEQGVLDLI